MKKIILLITLLMLSQISRGQEEFFNELEFSAKLLENEKWTLNVTPNWKHIYDEIGWRRWGLNINVKRKFEAWNLLAGIDNYYTFNKQINNFYEIRPWLGISLNTPISKHLAFNQRVKTEWRNFYFSGDEKEHDAYGRLRYQMALNILISENEEKNTEWTLVGFTEWYFLKNPSNGEQFPNSREYGLRIIHTFENTHEIEFGYKLEAFFEAANHDGGNGHTIILAYRM